MSADAERTALIARVGLDDSAHRVLTDLLAERHGWPRWPPPEDGEPESFLRHLLELAPWPEARLWATQRALVREVLPLWDAAFPGDPLLRDALDAPTAETADRLGARHESLYEAHWTDEVSTASGVLQLVMRACERHTLADDAGQFAWAAARRVAELLSPRTEVEEDADDEDLDDPFAGRASVVVDDATWRRLLGVALGVLDG